jgi:hypothetical protein
MGPRPTAAFAAQPTQRLACLVEVGGPLCAVNEPVRPAREQRLFGMLECTQERAQLTRHLADHARHATVAHTAASAQHPNVGKAFFYGLAATPRAGRARR